MTTDEQRKMDELDARRYRYIRDELAIGQATNHGDETYRWKFHDIPGKHKSIDDAVDAEIANGEEKT